MFDAKPFLPIRDYIIFEGYNDFNSLSGQKPLKPVKTLKKDLLKMQRITVSYL